MTKKKEPERTDVGNPAAAKIVNRIAQEVAKEQGKDKPDDSDEFYDRLLERTAPHWLSRKKSK
jgi:hypothetical protein